MAVTIDMVAIELGRPTPASDSIDAAQWATWIDRAERAIRLRADRLGVTFESLDVDAVNDVILYAVVRRATRPVDGAESVTEQVSVDDGSVTDTRKFPVGQGDIYFLDQWWRDLGLMPMGGRIGSMRIGVPSWRMPKVGM